MTGNRLYIKKFYRGNRTFYLIPDSYLPKARFLEWLTGKQNSEKAFYNVAFKPYRGKEYTNVVYVVEG